MNAKIMTSPATDPRIMSILRLNLVPVGIGGWRMLPVTSLGSSTGGSSAGFSGLTSFLKNDKNLSGENFMHTSLVLVDLLDNYYFLEAVSHLRLGEEPVYDVVVFLDPVVDEGYFLPVAYEERGGLS